MNADFCEDLLETFKAISPKDVSKAIEPANSHQVAYHKLSEAQPLLKNRTILKN